MPETIRMWIEVSFDILYLIAVWALVFTMYRRRSVVRTENRRVAGLVMIAFALLALGDTGHVGFRVAAYAMGDPAPQFSFLGMPFGLRGLGTAATAITVTLFYVLMVVIWRYRFDKQYGPFQHLLFAQPWYAWCCYRFPPTNGIARCHRSPGLRSVIYPY